MLAKANPTGKQSGATRQVYLQNDPTQNAFRMLVSLLDDRELLDLEDDLDLYQRSGLMSETLGQLLSDAQPGYSEVA